MNWIRFATMVGILLTLSHWSLLQAGPDDAVCGLKLEQQPGNTAYPYKVTKEGNFVSFVVIQEAAGKQVISFGGDFYKYDVKKKKLYHAEKMLKNQPASLQKAIETAFQMWAKEHCGVR